MSEWNLSDQELLIQKAEIIITEGKKLPDPYFFAKSDVKEFIRRLKYNEKEMWVVLGRLLIERYGQFMPSGIQNATLSTLLGKNIEDYLQIDKLAGDEFIIK